MMAKHGHDLLLDAQARGLDFSFEGSVGGGIPIISPLRQSLAANTFTEVVGIVNGTTNYILTRMAAEGADFADVLRDAQAHGYAEPDPAADVEGWDAQYKIADLAMLAFGARVDVGAIPTEGITRIGRRDMEVARDLGTSSSSWASRKAPTARWACAFTLPFCRPRTRSRRSTTFTTPST